MNKWYVCALIGFSALQGADSQLRAAAVDAYDKKLGAQRIIGLLDYRDEKPAIALLRTYVAQGKIDRFTVAVDEDGWDTPLYNAFHRGRFNVTRCMLQAFVEHDPKALTREHKGGETPLYMAAQWGDKESIEFLSNYFVEKGTIEHLVPQTTHLKMTPLHQALFSVGYECWNYPPQGREITAGGLVLINILAKHKPEGLIMKDDSGFTPLHWAAIYHNISAVDSLTQHFADCGQPENIELQNKAGATAYQHALVADARLGVAARNLQVAPLIKSRLAEAIERKRNKIEL